jgi:hypothetical protein
VTVAADDGTWTGTRSFLWTVTPSQAKLEQPESGGPVAAGVGTSFTARTTGTGLTYEWRFGDGTQPTARSSSPSVNHVFAGPGVYTVTVTVYDAQGRPVTGSFLQVVHGATGPQSARSSMIVLSGTGAAQRLWVANPDANTVAVFDAASRTRLADISVGCVLGYMDLRFAHIDWRSTHPNLARLDKKLVVRQSFIDTAPPAA